MNSRVRTGNQVKKMCLWFFRKFPLQLGLHEPFPADQVNEGMELDSPAVQNFPLASSSPPQILGQSHTLPTENFEEPENYGLINWGCSSYRKKFVFFGKSNRAFIPKFYSVTLPPGHRKFTKNPPWTRWESLCPAPLGTRAPSASFDIRSFT